MPSMSLFLLCNVVATPRQGTETQSDPLGPYQIRNDPQNYDFQYFLQNNRFYVAERFHGVPTKKACNHGLRRSWHSPRINHCQNIV